MPKKTPSLEELNKAFVDAVTDDAPIAVSTEAGAVVSGDSRKVRSIGKQDYELEFWLPVPPGSDTSGLELVQGGSAYVQRVTAEQRFISARIGRKVRNYASKLAIVFTQFKEEGATDVYTAEDMFKLYEIFDDSAIDACEKLLVEVLGISPNLIQYITDESLMQNVSLILKNNPNFFQVD